MLRRFGALRDGRTVRAASLTWPGGLAVEVLDYGAIVRSLRVPARAGPVEAVLGFYSLRAYEADHGYQGAGIGRCANRIDQARFEIDGRAFQVVANEGTTCLHGGVPGFDKRLWRFEEPLDPDGRTVALTYASPDGEEGFPGAVTARIVFTLTAADELAIGYSAETDAPTPVNLTHHLYFNLSGDHRSPALDHTLAIAASATTPVRPDLIPTGELAPVEGTPFDLRGGRVIGEALAEPHPQLTIPKGYDHNWALEAGAEPAVRLSCPRTGVSLSITTDQPGLQVYSGQGLAEPFAPFSGLALEPQGFPNAVNTPAFPDVILRPGQVYRRRSLYRLQSGEPG